MSDNSQAAVMPMIAVDSVDATRSFYVDKLGFEHQMGVVGKDGALDFCNVTLGGVALMFTRAEQAEGNGGPASRRVELYIGVQDVDGYHDTLKERGVEIADPLADQWWGDRTFVIQDPNRYRVWFYSHVAEVVPPPGTKIV